MEHPGTNFETYPFQHHTFSIGTERREFMRRSGKPLLAATWLAAFLIIPCLSRAADQDVQQKLHTMAKEIEVLKKQVAPATPEKASGKSISDWLTIGGDYRFRVDSLRGKVPDYWQFGFDPTTGNPVFFPVSEFKVKNDILYTNRFGLDLKAKATRNVSVTARLLMYKSFGFQDTVDSVGPFFADRTGVFDGTQRDVPAGLAPVSEAPPGAYAKICYGRGFENGITSTSGNGQRDTDMIGITVVPYDTDPLHVNVQGNRRMNH